MTNSKPMATVLDNGTAVFQLRSTCIEWKEEKRVWTSCNVSNGAAIIDLSIMIYFARLVPWLARSRPAQPGWLGPSNRARLVAWIAEQKETIRKRVKTCLRASQSGGMEIKRRSSSDSWVKCETGMHKVQFRKIWVLLFLLPA